MDSALTPIRLDAAARLGSSLPDASALPVQPAPPPELASRFQELMARLKTTADSSSGDSLLPASAVDAVENHLRTHAEVLESAAAPLDGDKSLVEIELMAMQNMVKLGMASMTQAAYFQVLGSAKSSVSALMKNQ